MRKKNQHDDINRKQGNSHASEKENLRFSKWLHHLDFGNPPVSDQQIEAERQQFSDYFKQTYPVSQTPQRKLVIWKAVAAAAILAIVFGTWLYRAPQPAAAISYTTISTTVGQRKIVTLPDGSTVWLNNQSELHFPTQFNLKNRQVKLIGEAFFEVIHDPKRPFTVKTGALSTRVLGTSFNIRNYIDDQTTDVVVVTGMVGVKPATGQSRILKPGNQLSYERATGQMLQNSVDPKDHISWQQGALVFKNEKLEVICKRLERWFGVKIEIQTPALKNRKLSIRHGNESLAVVLKTLSLVGDFKYELKPGKATIW